MAWTQNYSALGDNIFLTALVVAIPIFFLFWALAIKKMKGHIAGVLTLLIAFVDVVLVYGMPVNVAFSATILGIMNGLFPIGWIIITAVFFYNLTVEAGAFEVIKSSIASLSSDRRLQALLIAFSFSAFMEGAAGQGAPVAVAAAILIGLGFPALPAAVICLVANVPPVPFGPVGTPTITMGKVTAMNDAVLAHGLAVNMSLFCIIIPFAMLLVLCGWKATKEVIPAALVSGISFAIPFYFLAKFNGPMLPSVVGSVVSIICTALFIKVWSPKTIWRFENDPETPKDSQHKYTGGQIFKAWSPYLVLMTLMGIWGTPQFKSFAANDLQWFINIKEWPGLHGFVMQAAPIVAEPKLYAASYKWDIFGYAGTAMLIAAVITLFILKISPSTAVKVFGRTMKQLAYSLITVMSVLGLAWLANYSGMSFTLGLAFASTGILFPFFSPVLGWLGVFLTGSVTSSGALFGMLQKVTATQLGLNPVLTVTANLLGGSMGKLISPQSIAIACAATGLIGSENQIFRKTAKYSVYLLLIVMVIIFLEAYLLPGVMPTIASGS
ncbi:lactate permease LctP family transporter [Desulfitobacterium sp. THU1]|uniref:L-lactate permease n=1 Tax=Desulfitobacterium sp. THU1 TaxID=3138072 RepID=UPI00311F9DFA